MLLFSEKGRIIERERHVEDQEHWEVVSDGDAAEVAPVLWAHVGAAGAT
jgi:hypothetical protein